MPPDTATRVGKANDLAIALKWWNAGYHEDQWASWVAHVVNDIATLEHKSPHDIAVIARARLAVARVAAAKGGPDVPSGGIVNTIGGTVAQGANTVGDVVKAPLSVAEFLAKLADPFILIRVAEVIGGGVAIGIGVGMLAKQSGVSIPFIPGG